MDKYAEVVQEFEQDITPAELRDILMAIRILKRASGWGKVEIIYTNKDMNTIETTITQKPQKEKEQAEKRV